MITAHYTIEYLANYADDNTPYTIEYLASIMLMITPTIPLNI